MKGIPTRTEFDGWLEGDVNVSLDTSSDDSVSLEFKVRSNEPEIQEAHEALSALALHHPKDIGFEFWIDDEVARLVCCPKRSSVVYELGIVPIPVAMFVRKFGGLIETRGHVLSVYYGQGISLVGHEIDKHRVMRVADDDLDRLTEKEFDDLMWSMKYAMGQQVHVVKLGLRLSRESYGRPASSVEVFDV